ncbi:hypothetical protein [Acaryochloris marina]|uniref:Oligosaccharide repeat unit polymerase n=1 Tax=Acaryochloris marina (strain MBIC 11017) TaxID=329726 RepID=B0C3H1_ACAM1|nr:hypothetical protein [Acaryochloris marina]ABW29805.1 hypothetical protein AM1_4834 [Acaryochloris marina MBIC11017]
MILLAYLGLVIFIVIFELIRDKQTLIDFLSFFNVLFCLAFPLPGIFLLLSEHSNLNTSILKGTTINLNSFQVPLLIFLTYFFVAIGFHLDSATNSANRIYIKEKNSGHFVFTYALILLLISFSSIVVYSVQNGGLINAISNASLLRSTVIETPQFSLVKRFFLLSFMGSFLISSILFNDKSKGRSIQLLIIFIFSISISLLSFFLIATRANVLRYLLTFYLVYSIRKGKHSLGVVIFFITLLAIISSYGKEIFGSLIYLSDGIDAVTDNFQNSVDANIQSESDPSNVLDEFSAPFFSIFAATNSTYELRLLSDWFYGLASFLPDRIYEAPPTVSYYNTNFLVNTDKYEIPSGFISSCLYSMSWPGLIIFSLSYGWIGRFIQQVTYNHSLEIHWMQYIYVYSALVWSDYTIYADPKILLQTHFWFFISCFFLIVLSSNLFISDKYSIARMRSDK